MKRTKYEMDMCMLGLKHLKQVSDKEQESTYGTSTRSTKNARNETREASE